MCPKLSAVDGRYLASPAGRQSVNRSLEKAARFVWRTARNLLCISSWGKSRLFPPKVIADRFGRGDPDYAVRVFLHHYRQLSAAGFQAADTVMEVGPGRNLGTALLMWALNQSRSNRGVTVILWDIFPNMVVDADSFREVASTLLDSPGFTDVLDALPDDRIDQTLGMVVRRDLMPDIRYRIKPMPELVQAEEASEVGLVYSQAAIEHIWHIADFWRAIIGVTKSGGWHSHRIDLADHGRRETNYIEMLEWSPLSYWMMMSFVPGAINRWRASMHLEFVTAAGLKVLRVSRETREVLPIPRSFVSRPFRSFDELDLRTTALDLVAVKLPVSP